MKSDHLGVYLMQSGHGHDIISWNDVWYRWAVVMHIFARCPIMKFKFLSSGVFSYAHWAPGSCSTEHFTAGLSEGRNDCSSDGDSWSCHLLWYPQLSLWQPERHRWGLADCQDWDSRRQDIVPLHLTGFLWLPATPCSQSFWPQLTSWLCFNCSLSCRDESGNLDGS